MPGFGCFQYHLDGFAIAQLAHQNDIRRLPQCRPQSHRDAGNVAVQLALVDRGRLVVVQELDGIFDGDDVTDLLLVDEVEQTRPESTTCPIRAVR